MINSKNNIEEKNKKDTFKMCDSCLHKLYCFAAYIKDCWCGNHKIK